MNKRSTFFIAALCILFAAPSLASQEASDPYAIVLYATGSEIGIFRSGESYDYNLARENVIGLPLFEGDLVQTERGTFLEIQLLPSKTILRVTENTSFKIQGLGSNGATSFQLLYGRVRAQVDRVSASNSFQIRGRTAVAGVRGTDFGYDYVVPQGSFTEPVTQIYCFEGSVEVAFASESTSTADQDEAAQEAQAAQSAAPVLIAANQMIALREQAPVPADSGQEASGLETPTAQGAPAAQPLSTDLNNYWANNPIVSEAVDIAEIDKKFPQLKVRILEARRQARLIAEQKALQAGLQSLPEFQERVEALKLPEPSYADTLAAFEPVGAAGLIRSAQPQVLVPNTQRGLGIFLTGAGSFMSLGAVSVLGFGEGVYGLNPDAVLPVAIGLGIGAAVSLVIGLPLYLDSIPPR